MHWGLLESQAIQAQRASNLLDGGAPFYDVYATSDRRHVAVGALEPKFFATLVELLEVTDRCPGQDDVASYARMRALFAERFGSRTMAEWATLFEGTDACVAPVLTPREAADHPHLVARETFTRRAGRREPMPAPRFSRTGATVPSAPSAVGASTRAALTAWGVTDVDGLIERGVAVQA